MAASRDLGSVARTITRTRLGGWQLPTSGRLNRLISARFPARRKWSSAARQSPSYLAEKVWMKGVREMAGAIPLNGECLAVLGHLRTKKKSRCIRSSRPIHPVRLAGINRPSSRNRAHPRIERVTSKWIVSESRDPAKPEWLQSCSASWHNAPVQRRAARRTVRCNRLLVRRFTPHRGPRSAKPGGVVPLDEAPPV